MADPSSKQPDQPAEAKGTKPEDAAAGLHEILSSPIENPFAAEANRAASPPDPPASEPAPAPPPDSPASQAAPVPPDFVAWEGAKPSAPEGAPEAVSPQLSETAPAGESKAAAAGEPAPPGAPPDPSAARVIAKVRRLMLISTVLTALAIAAVFGVIGYRVFKSEGRQEAPTQATLTLPQDAKIVQTAIADDRIVLTLQVGGALEIRTYDLKTLKPLGRLNFSTVP